MVSFGAKRRVWLGVYLASQEWSIGHGGHHGEVSLSSETKGQGPRLVLAHGFTQNRNCWGHFADNLAADHEVVTVDMAGHGETDPAHDASNLNRSAELLAEAGGKATYVGYSMGGRVAIHLALLYPELVDALVLIGATPGIDDAEARLARIQSDEVLAAKLESIGLEQFLHRWLSAPLFDGLTDETACLSERMTNRVQGLAASLRNTGTGTQESLWSRLGEIVAPVVVLVGQADTKFCEIGMKMVDHLPRASMACLPATHAVHLEQPVRSAEMVRRLVGNRA